MKTKKGKEWKEGNEEKRKEEKKKGTTCGGKEVVEA